MKEQTIPFSYSGGGGGRTLVNNPYNFIINDECEAYGEYTKINMYEYAKRMIPNYQNITEIPDGHLPKDLDPYGYEDNWSNAFNNCRNLTSLPDPFYNWNGTTNIHRIFYYCSNLTGSIPKIPDSVINMRYAFAYCSKLALFVISCTTPPNTGYNAPFSGTPTSTCVLQVPAGCKESYAGKNYWGDFDNIIEL